MRLTVVLSTLWVLVCTLGAHAAGEDAAEKGIQSLSPAKLKDAVAQVPKKLNLGADNFLGLGVKRKSVAGAYGTSAAVTLGAAAIGYQATNLRSQERTAYKKALKDAEQRQAICATLHHHQAHAAPGILAAAQARSVPAAPGAANPPPVMPAGQAASESRRWGTPWSQNQGRPTLEWKRRALTDETLVTIEDYNKFIGATEGLASGGIAVTGAVESRQRSLDAGTKFRC